MVFLIWRNKFHAQALGLQMQFCKTYFNIYVFSCQKERKKILNFMVTRILQINVLIITREWNVLTLLHVQKIDQWRHINLHMVSLHLKSFRNLIDRLFFLYCSYIFSQQINTSTEKKLMYLI